MNVMMEVTTKSQSIYVQSPSVSYLSELVVKIAQLLSLPANVSIYNTIKQFILKITKAHYLP